ncbi:CDGSH iron-sulfur domain-containing protein [Longispora urticae]
MNRRPAAFGLVRRATSRFGQIRDAAARGLRRLASTVEDRPASRPPAGDIVPYTDGPLLVRGDVPLHSVDGRNIDPGRVTYALCRCGKSGTKPFCDGTHKVSGFQAPSGRQTPQPRTRQVD